MKWYKLGKFYIEDEILKLAHSSAQFTEKEVFHRTIRRESGTDLLLNRGMPLPKEIYVCNQLCKYAFHF